MGIDFDSIGNSNKIILGYFLSTYIVNTYFYQWPKIIIESMCLLSFFNTQIELNLSWSVNK